MHKIVKLGIILGFCLNSCFMVFAQDNETATYLEETELSSDTLSDTGSENESADSAINYAVSKLGYPYSMSRRHSGTAFDCSSLVYYSYQDAGIDLSYQGMTTAAAIGNKLVDEGKEVSAEEIEPGDLIFYSYERNGRYHNISHVAMYIGDGKQIEASYGKQEVAIRDLSFDEAVNICRPVS